MRPVAAGRNKSHELSGFHAYRPCRDFRIGVFETQRAPQHPPAISESVRHIKGTKSRRSPSVSEFLQFELGSVPAPNVKVPRLCGLPERMRLPSWVPVVNFLRIRVERTHRNQGVSQHCLPSSRRRVWFSGVRPGAFGLPLPLCRFPCSFGVAAPVAAALAPVSYELKPAQLNVLCASRPALQPLSWKCRD